MAPRRFPLGIVLALSALAAAGRMAFLWAPNVAPTFFIAFVAGVAYGTRAGVAVGGLSMIATDLLISAVHPILFANVTAMAAVGAAGGVLGRFVDLGQRGDADPAFVAALAGFVGAVALVVFSLVADAVTWVLFLRNGAFGWAFGFPAPDGASSFLVLAGLGLAFNALPAAINAMVFAAATRPSLTALRRAGLVTARRARADTTP